MTERPVVVHFFGTYLPASEVWVHRQLTALQRYEPLVLARRLERVAEFLLPRPPVAEGRGWRGRAGRRVLGVAPRQLAAARTAGARLVHAHFGPVGRRAMALARRLRVPLVVSFYGRDLFAHPRGTTGLRRAYRQLFRCAALLLVEGPAAAARLVELGAPPERVRVHRLGLDPAAYPFRPRRRAPDEPLRVLLACRFTAKKGLPYAFVALARVAAEGLPLAIEVVGDAGADPAERRLAERLRTFVAQRGLTPHVRWLGFQSAAGLRAAMDRAHVLLHPSVRTPVDGEGGHPVVLTEAAACGLGLIATDHGDIPQLVVPGESGWLCPERDVTALVTALRQAATEPERLAAYGVGARRRVEHLYDLRRATWDPVYDAVLGACSSTATALS